MCSGISESYSGTPAVVGIRRVVAQLRVLEELAHRVDPEAVDPAVDPEAQDVEHRLADGRVAPVQVRLLLQVGVVVAAVADLLPGRAAEHGDPVVGRRAVVPEVPVGVPVLEPRVQVGRVVRDVVEQDLEAELVGAGEERVEVVQRPVLRIDRRVVGDVVAEVALRRLVDRRQPDRVDAERAQVRQPLRRCRADRRPRRRRSPGTSAGRSRRSPRVSHHVIRG